MIIGMFQDGAAHAIHTADNKHLLIYITTCFETQTNSSDKQKKREVTNSFSISIESSIFTSSLVLVLLILI